ncbi:hypothetical protein Geob_0089 [Geotalea daltonii FRC-32]|uniref:Uncharacterized protein n=1 Tax=Geotalea daltonii (strain DSM 22248 / JCM 15807 / FRC-32) TaxID=316067 RepID=B9M8C8_GEODF|nr:carboxypeptidase-like regulatory domain-containing protein [Geotalea daltonii]ACM18463.1 hypothetical protein Geob_0089 [Geotalea daltonii FRC-32]
MKRNSMMWLVSLVLVTVVALLPGCGSDTNVYTSTGAKTGIVTGRVVDSSTMQPIANADVTLVANGEKMAGKTSASSDPDLAGTFVFTGVSSTAPYVSSHTLKISASGYATMQMGLIVSSSADNAPTTTSLGNISLAKGFDLTVVATDEGTPVAGVTISAASSGVPITAVTDAGGKAILKGLSQEASYTIASAPFYDNNGALKYLSTTTSYTASSSHTLSMSLIPANSTSDINIVGSNLLRDGSKNYYSYPSTYNHRVILPESVIKLVFNYPVTLSGAITASYLNDQVASSDPDYRKIINVPTISAALDETGTILTITNSAPYLKNQTYIFNGTVTAVINSVSRSLSLSEVSASNPYFSNKVYVADNSSTGLSSTTAVKADNFNGTTGTTGTTQPNQVWLVFPEKVYGTYSIIATRISSSGSWPNSSPVSFGFADGDVTYAENSGGADQASLFKLRVSGLTLADNTGSNINEVTIDLKATDAEGNVLNRTLTLPVQ